MTLAIGFAIVKPMQNVVSQTLLVGAGGFVGAEEEE